MTRVPAIQVPTIAICGRDDQLTPIKFHEYLRHNMPNCDLRVIDEAGHWPFVEQPRIFGDLVEQYLHATLAE